MNISKLGAVSIFIAFSYCSTAGASLITCEPDDYAGGANLENACEGVVLSVTARSDDVFAEIPSVTSATSTGSKVFGHGYDDYGWGISDANPEALRGDFDVAVDSVSIDLIGNDDYDSGFLRVFDSSDNLLQEIVTGIIGTNSVFTANIARMSADIAYFIASGSNGNNINLDNLSYNSVPEASSIALLSLGLVVLGFVRRKSPK